jgi:thymidylate kinase
MPYPIFVLEGPDNGGKSTLAKALARRCKAKIIHSTYRFKGRMYAYHLAQFRKALKIAQTQPVVMDRWWPSEVCYGNTFRSGPEFNFNIDMLSQLGKAYLVSFTYCMPTRWEEYWAWCDKSWRQEDEMYQKDEGRYNWLWKCYRELMVNNYGYYHQNLIQHYNVTLEGPRNDHGDSFAQYIIARSRDNLHRMSPEEKDLFKRMSQHYRLVGRVRLEDLPPLVLEPPPPPPPIPSTPIQGSLF